MSVRSERHIADEFYCPGPLSLLGLAFFLGCSFGVYHYAFKDNSPETLWGQIGLQAFNRAGACWNGMPAGQHATRIANLSDAEIKALRVAASLCDLQPNGGLPPMTGTLMDKVATGATFSARTPEGDRRERANELAKEALGY